jgi:hypothetical protein
LYKGKYREEVYEDDDETPKQELSEESVAEQPSEETADSFVETKEQSPDHNYKKRYDDLKRHYDEKLKEFQTKEEELRKMAEKAQSASVPLPKTEEELQDFKSQYPDVYDVVETVAAMRASEQASHLQEELKELKERERNLQVQSAYRELKNLHPDFDDLRSDDKFVEWLDEQPSNISDGILKNNTDVKWAARVVDLYKVDAGISRKTKKRTNSNDAAASVTSTKAKDISSEERGDKRIWKASQIAKLKPWEFEKLEEELDTARAEGRIDFKN